MDGAVRKYPKQMANQQSLSNLTLSMIHVLKYLKMHERLSASRVCHAWSLIATYKPLWRTVCLQDSKVCNWDKCIDALIYYRSISLDTRCMFIPKISEEFNRFWCDFTVALKKKPQLKSIKLYGCPPDVVEETISTLHQLSILNATYIKNPSISKEKKNRDEFMIINLHSLDQMINLTEIKMKGLTGIKLTCLPSFESLVNLKSLSLTSIKAFPKDICYILETLSTSLEFFEIGDCDCLSKDFSGVLKRLTNLTALRMENCSGRFENFAKEVLSSIRGLDKLKILELINIEFSYDVEGELEKCTNIKALLIIPAYNKRSAATNSHLIDCLKKLSKTLTHLVWGVTLELTRATELSVIRNHSILHNYFKRAEYIPILSGTKHRFEEDSILKRVLNDKNDEEKCDILSVPGLEESLRKMFINTKVVKKPFEKTTRVYLSKIFNNL